MPQPPPSRLSLFRSKLVEGPIVVDRLFSIALEILTESLEADSAGSRWLMKMGTADTMEKDL